MTTSLLDAAPRADFVLLTDSAQTIPLVFEDENGATIDFTGSTFQMVVKARDSNNAPMGSAVLTLSTGSGIAGDVSAGEFEPTFPKSSGGGGGLAAGSYIYEVRRLESAVAVEISLVGLIDVYAGMS